MHSLQQRLACLQICVFIEEDCLVVLLQSVIHANAVVTRLLKRGIPFFIQIFIIFTRILFILSCGHNFHPENYIHCIITYVRVAYHNQNKIFFIRKVYDPLELFTRNYRAFHPELFYSKLPCRPALAKKFFPSKIFTLQLRVHPELTFFSRIRHFSPGNNKFSSGKLFFHLENAFFTWSAYNSSGIVIISPGLHKFHPDWLSQASSSP